MIAVVGVREAARVVLAAVLGMSAFPAASAAQDKVIARDRFPIVQASALAGRIVYQRDLPRGLVDRTSPWMRVVGGRRRAVHGMPADAYRGFEAIGRDRAGRVVLPFLRETLTRDRRLINPRWWLYDVARDAARPLRGLPQGACSPSNVSVWRKQIAYQLTCSRKQGIYLRDDKRTRRVSRLSVSDATAPLVLRGRTLVMIAGRGDSEFALWRLVSGGRVCQAMIEPSVGAPDDDFSVGNVWLTGRRLSWWMERDAFSTNPPAGGNLVLGTTLPRDCSPPTPTAGYAPLDSLPMAVDGPALYHAAGKILYRREPVRPSTAPPPNDDFTAAEEIIGEPSLSVGIRVGYATRQPGEPPVRGVTAEGLHLSDATRTVWYAYRPVKRQRLFVYTNQWEFLDGLLPVGAVAVFDGDEIAALGELPATFINGTRTVAFEAIPGHSYRIAVGCDTPGPCYPSFGLFISLEPPPGN